ncbi:MAG: type II toxin-antitoxin system RelE/ParE family toxin [Planctomycetia bacterium]|nr:type II toxin-antitoxin system RelE/ParE family toxin [Planctomycetia bacterium]
MSAYAVELTPEAENNLIEIWLDATDRVEVTESETAIHGLLRSDPIGQGVPVAEGLYKIVRGPLVAFYSVDDAQQRVEIDRIWRPS